MRRRKDSKRQKEGNESEESEYLVQSGEETDGKLAAGDEMKSMKSKRDRQRVSAATGAEGGGDSLHADPGGHGASSTCQCRCLANDDTDIAQLGPL